MLERESPPRHIERDPLLGREFLHARPEHLAPRSGPRTDRPLAQREIGIGNDAVQREREHVAEPAAPRTRAGGAVEREQRRLGRHGRRAAGGALPALAPRLGRAVAAHDLQSPFTAPERLLEGIHQALALHGGPGEAIHHHVNALGPRRQLRQRIERQRLVGPPDPRVARLLQVLGLLLPRQSRGQGHGGEDHHALGRPGLRLAGDGGGAVGGHHGAAVAAMHLAEAREQQPQIVVDLGGGADGRSRGARG